MQVKFIPRHRRDLPALEVEGEAGRFFFRCLNINGDVEVETVHHSLSDGLMQVARRMALDAGASGPAPEYEVEA